VNAWLGSIQNSSPADAPINYYASKQFEEAIVFGENVRAMGTFPYITGFGLMAMVGAWAGLTLLSHSQTKRRYLWMGVLIYAAALWCALLSISRGPTIIVLALFVIWLFSGKGIVGNFVQAGTAIAALVLLLILGGRISVIENATDVMIARHAESEETVAARATLPIEEIAEASSTAPFGAGFGSEQVGGVFADTGIMSFRTFEGQFARLIMEAGIIGVAGFLIVCLGLLKALYDAKKSARTEALRRTIIITIALAGLMFYGNVIFDHVASFFVWAIGAAVLASVSEQTHVVSQAHR
jgi:O-antigen ligase